MFSSILPMCIFFIVILFLAPWTPAIVLLQLIYIMANVFCISFRAPLLEAATRAGALSLINLFVPFAGPHLSFVADLTGMSLNTFKLVHQSTGLMSFSLALFHVLFMAKSRPFSLNVPENLFGLVVSMFLSILSPLQLIS